MLQELSGFALGSVSTLSRRTAQEALEQFLAEPPLDNATGAGLALRQLQVLHGKLAAAGGAPHAASLARQWSNEARRLEATAQRQLELLGVYREHGEAVKGHVRSWERRSALVEVDKIWWELRSSLDAYLEAAELQTSSFLESLTILASFQHCSSSLQEVQKSYAKSLATRDMGHAVLRETWQQSEDLLGELAAVLVDGEVFEIFFKDCNNTLAKQTMKQVKFAVSALGLLKHRFAAGGLPRPDGSSMLKSVARIQQSFKAARAKCQAPQLLVQQPQRLEQQQSMSSLLWKWLGRQY